MLTIRKTEKVKGSIIWKFSIGKVQPQGRLKRKSKFTIQKTEKVKGSTIWKTRLKKAKGKFNLFQTFWTRSECVIKRKLNHTRSKTEKKTGFRSNFSPEILRLLLAGIYPWYQMLSMCVLNLVSNRSFHNAQPWCLTFLRSFVKISFGVIPCPNSSSSKDQMTFGQNSQKAENLTNWKMIITF